LDALALALQHLPEARVWDPKITTKMRFFLMGEVGFLQEHDVPLIGRYKMVFFIVLLRKMMCSP
jgi:hypothetical protein